MYVLLSCSFTLTIYSGTSLCRAPLGPSRLSCIQWNLSIEDTIDTQLSVLYREVSLIQRYVDLHTALCGWDCRQRSVPLIQSVLCREVPLYHYWAMMGTRTLLTCHLHVMGLMQCQCRPLTQGMLQVWFWQRENSLWQWAVRRRLRGHIVGSCTLWRILLFVDCGTAVASTRAPRPIPLMLSPRNIVSTPVFASVYDEWSVRFVLWEEHK